MSWRECITFGLAVTATVLGILGNTLATTIGAMIVIVIVESWVEPR